ncbi:MAG: cobalt-precorrin-5B (C(1))-methyltransferase [Aestuariibacter sp.]|nr:cobalt-precorrin-5B (C(1))-methyltransferase [Aestuariibacter sp.]MCP5017449.1 cobalt-precorrin-5B (C(1))-methyltransferase [Ketobacter sp.]
MKKQKRPAKERLRTGFTTGACAAAAARVATLGLVHGEMPATVETLLPNGQRVYFNVHESELNTDIARAVVIKDAGDDPDCTHGAHLTVEVNLLPGQASKIALRGGNGVGVVTQPGLGLDVGGPAINPVPHKNICANVREAGAGLLAEHGLLVTISVPGGEDMAKKTLNARLGILGGISILGTTGIVKPYSTSAFRASVVQGIQVAARQGHNTVVLTTGGRTEKFTMQELPHLAESCFIQMGDFLRYALDAAQRCQLQQVVIGGMVGKLTKMAQGETITHANRAEVDTGLLADIAQELHVDAEVCAAIRQNQTARFASEQMQALGLSEPFHTRLAERVIATLMHRYPNAFRLTILVTDFDGNKIAEASSS